MEVLTAPELEHLAEVREVTICANSAGWIRILQQMEKFVTEAHEDMFGAIYASDAIKANLQNRWQQREAMLRGVKQYVKDCQDEKDMLLITFNKERSSDAEPAEDSYPSGIEGMFGMQADQIG